MIKRARESRKNWNELVGLVCVSINNSVMRTGILSRAKAFLGQRHYHLMLRRFTAEESDEVVFSLHNDAIKIGRMRQRGTVDAIVKNFKVGDLVKIKNHKMKKSDGSRFADPAVESPLVIVSITGTTAAMRNLLNKDFVERSLTEVKALDALDLVTFRNVSLTKFFQLAAETTKRKTKRGRKKKLPQAATGKEQAVARGDTEVEQAREATEDEVTADDSKGEEGKDELGPRRSKHLRVLRMGQL